MLELEDLNVQHQAGIRLEPGERLLVCGDGLTEMVSDGEISWVLGGQPDPEAVVSWLIDAANSAGGVDNIAVIVVNAEAAERQDDSGWQKEHGVDHADYLDALLDPDDPLHAVARRAAERDPV